MNTLDTRQPTASPASVQETLFDVARPAPRASSTAVMGMEPLSRSGDPTGSYQAAERIQLSGAAGRQRRAVYAALRLHPGRTSRELARLMDVDRYQPSRRLPELEHAGWVRRGQRRRCSIGGIVSETWWPVG